MTACPPPLVAVALWRAVMDRASQGGADPRCECEGACGQPHIKGGGRCPRTHGQYVKNHGTIRLHAAPRDLSVSVVAAAALPAEALAAWCPTCHAAAYLAATREARAAACAALLPTETLF